VDWPVHLLACGSTVGGLAAGRTERELDERPLRLVALPAAPSAAHLHPGLALRVPDYLAPLALRRNQSAERGVHRVEEIFTL
jgi:hypothetical protein